ncbi:MAG: glycosyltransferase [Acidobacteriia bacterium]|nr:glycosyltransferase [Terriglobia bacterium]
MEVWADLFNQVVIAGPCRDELPPPDCAALQRRNITIDPQPEAGGESVRGKIGLLRATPVMIWRLMQTFHKVDAIHTRCPGNLGLLGTLLGPLFSRRLICKYAGQWTSYPGEALSVRFQKRVLSSRWWRGPVTVYGDWPGQPAHVIPFFTSVLSRAQVARARAASERKRFRSPLHVLYVGRLSASKNVDKLLEALRVVRDHGYRMHATIVGDGPERYKLEILRSRLHLTEDVEFAGAVDFDRVMSLLETSDVLVLASNTEGWPKAIAEAMAFGLICIGSDRGLIPQMLGNGRGLLVPPRDVSALAAKLEMIAAAPENYTEMSRRAASWAQRFSLDGLRDALCSLMSSSWGVTFAETREPEVHVVRI